MRRWSAGGGEALTARPPDDSDLADPPDHGAARPPDAPPVTAGIPQVIDSDRPAPPRRLLRGAERLAPLVGRRLLVGITYLDADGEPAAAEQFCGTVLDVAEGVVTVERPGAEPALLPADPDAYEPAAAGRYTLGATGEVVRDPDYVTTWRVALG